MSLAFATRPSDSADFYDALLATEADIVARYRALTPKSAELMVRAGASFPGGYTRDAVMRKPYAPFMVAGQGATLTDADGRAITDFWFNATSLPLGHADPRVTSAAASQLARGTAYYAPTAIEIELGELLLERLPSAERIRFANSGSEAVMLAVRFARAATNRPAIVKFEGSYHGSYDDVSWSVSPSLALAGEANAPKPVPETLGLADPTGRTIVLPFDDAAALEAYVSANAQSIAAILVEPMANKIGLILPSAAFLAKARDLATRYGIVLVFDEVIAFRVGYNGAQGLVGIEPDVTTLGKIIGGGFPIGAVAGKARILDLSDGRSGRVTHAGTFNANPMTTTAGLATMRAMTPEVFAALNAEGDYVRQRLGSVFDGLPIQVTGTGSLFKVSPTPARIRNYRDAATSNKAWEALVSLALYNEGFLLTSQLQGCISAATTRTHTDALIDAFARIVRS